MVDWNKLIETGGSIKVELSAADLNNLANETGRKSAQELYDLLQKEESGEYMYPLYQIRLSNLILCA